MIRFGFISNSSSSSFIIPKKHMVERDLKLYKSMANEGSTFCEDELFTSKYYIHGKVSIHNTKLKKMFDKYRDMDGVEL